MTREQMKEVADRSWGQGGASHPVNRSCPTCDGCGRVEDCDPETGPSAAKCDDCDGTGRANGKYLLLVRDYLSATTRLHLATQCRFPVGSRHTHKDLGAVTVENFVVDNPDELFVTLESGRAG